MSEMTAIHRRIAGCLTQRSQAHSAMLARWTTRSDERHLNIHFTPEIMAGVYANFANISHSDYEFTITFARVDHEVDDDEVPGVVVSRVNLSPRFMRELHRRDAGQLLQVVGARAIRELPEVEETRDDEDEQRPLIRIVAVGRPRGPLAEAAHEYETRLGRALRLEVVEVREEPLQRGTPDEVQEREGRRIEPHLEGWPLVCLDRTGRALDSRGARACCCEREERPPQRTAFVIGGAERGVAGAAAARRDAALAGAADAAAPAGAGGARRAALPRDHDPARRAVPPLGGGGAGAARRPTAAPAWPAA